MRKRAMMLAALSIPVLFFVLVEALLALLGVGGPQPLFVPVPGNSDYQVPNPDVGLRYFGSTNLVPGPPHDAFLAEKPPGALRIVVQGGSSAAGFPFEYGGGSFPRMLEQRLAQTFPDRQVEVINTGIDAVSSYVPADFGHEIMAIAPDAVLIYAGHNEYYGAFGVASSESPGSGHALKKIYLRLDRFRLVQALRATWARFGASGTPHGDSTAATLMEVLALGREVEYGSNPYERGIEQYRANLNSMACSYQDAGIPVFIGTLVSNERDVAPFSGGRSAGVDSLQWLELRGRESRAAAASDTLALLQTLREIVALDSGGADAYFRLGRVLEWTGDPEGAAVAYRNARDRDRLPFRAPSAMTSVVREVAEACSATVVDLGGAFAAASAIGVPGAELLLEHVHPSVDGYFIMADRFYGAIKDAEIPEPWTRVMPGPLARSQVLVTGLDSVLAAIQIRRLTTRWPFPTAQEGLPPLRFSGRPAELAEDVVRGRQSWFAATVTLGEWYQEQGQLEEAFRAGQALMQDRPYLAGPYLINGRLAMRSGRLEEAGYFFRRADALDSTSETKRLIGQMLTRTGRPIEALPWLEQAISLDAENAPAHYDHAVALLGLGREAEAREAALLTLTLEPAHSGAARLLGRVSSGQTE